MRDLVARYARKLVLGGVPHADMLLGHLRERAGGMLIAPFDAAAALERLYWADRAIRYYNMAGRWPLRLSLAAISVDIPVAATRDMCIYGLDGLPDFDFVSVQTKRMLERFLQPLLQPLTICEDDAAKVADLILALSHRDAFVASGGREFDRACKVLWDVCLWQCVSDGITMLRTARSGSTPYGIVSWLSELSDSSVFECESEWGRQMFPVEAILQKLETWWLLAGIRSGSRSGLSR